MKECTRRAAARSKWILLAAFAFVVCALVFTACGDDGGDATSEPAATSTEEEASGGEEVSGEPIVTWTYTDVNTEGAAYKNLEETVRVYQEWINTHGGIAGRPLEANFCDSRGTPTAAATCAREAVADEAVAMVGSFSFTGDAVIPILEKSNTAQFGICCAIAPPEYTSKISFPMGNQPLYGPGLVTKAIQDGCEKIPVVLIEGAEVFEGLMENAAKAEGGELEKFVSVPAVPQDYSAEVAEATSSNPDCLVTLIGESNYVAWMPAFQQSGSEARIYGPQGNFNEIVIEGFEDLVDGDVVSGMYPDISIPAWSEYREALDQYEADTSLDYNSLGGLGAWAAFEGFKQVVESMGGEELNNDTFVKAAETAIVDLPGMVPPLDFSLNWGEDGGPEGFDRVVNRCVVYSEFKEGTLVPTSTEFTDLSEASGGTKPADCGPPFGS